MNETIILSEKISALRRAAGMTQEQLATRLGVTYQAVSKWENAQSCPDIMLLPVLADVFHVSLDHLFGRETEALVPVSPAKTEETSAEGEPAYPRVCFVYDRLPWEDGESLYAVLFRGHQLVQHRNLPPELSSLYEKIQLCCQGDVEGDVNSDFSVSVNGSVGGDIDASLSVQCGGSVGGGISAGGDVSCGAVENGDVDAGGQVSCGSVSGDVDAGGDVNCSVNINGDVDAGGDVNCSGSINGDVDAGCDVSCGGGIYGDIDAGCDISCGLVYGDVDAGGDVDCGPVSGDVDAGGNVSIHMENAQGDADADFNVPGGHVKSSYKVHTGGDAKAKKSDKRVNVHFGELDEETRRHIESIQTEAQKLGKEASRAAKDISDMVNKYFNEKFK